MVSQYGNDDNVGVMVKWWTEQTNVQWWGRNKMVTVWSSWYYDWEYACWSMSLYAGTIKQILKILETSCSMFERWRMSIMSIYSSIHVNFTQLSNQETDFTSPQSNNIGIHLNDAWKNETLCSKLEGSYNRKHQYTIKRICTYV